MLYKLRKLTKPAGSVLLLTLLLLSPLVLFAQPSDSEWLIGTWEGALVDYTSKEGPHRTLKVLAVAANGKGRGTWFITGQDEYLARITTYDNSSVKIISAANSIIELARQNENELVGSFMLSNGRTHRIGLRRVSRPVEPASDNLASALIGHWEGTIKFTLIGSEDPRRTLYIDSVRQQQGGQWTAQGRWGFRGRRFERVAVNIDTSAKHVEIRFVDAYGAAIRLQSFKDKDLVGTIRWPRIGAGLDPQFAEPPMHLERVE